MFERYTEQARRVLFFARYEASQCGSPSISPEHLLLGLIREGKGMTARLFARSNISQEKLRREIENRVAQRAKTTVSHEISFTRPAKSVLKAAAEEADRLLHNYIGAEHLLLGILSVDKSGASALLAEHGMQLAGVRDHFVSLLNEQPAAGGHADELTPEHVLARLKTRASMKPVVYVVPTETQDQNEIRGHEVWALRGLALRSALERASSFPPTRIELPGTLDTKQLYDYLLIGLPFPEPNSFAADVPGVDIREGNQVAWRMARALEESRQRLMRDGIGSHFNATIAPEARAMDVFVLTAPHGPGPGISKEYSGLASVGGVGFGVVGEAFDEFSLLDAFRSGAARFDTFKSVGWSGAFLTSASGSGMTLQEYGYLLEAALGRPVVDETGLYGKYTLQMEGDANSQEEFLARLRDQLGLVLTRERRDVTFLVMRIH